MLKDKFKGVIAGIIIGSTLTGGFAFAKSGTEFIEALYSDIKIYIDGVKVETKDANGTKVEPFIYNGTTYLPVRGIAQAMGSQVQWDGESNSVYLWDKLVPGGTYLLDVCEPYDTYYYTEYLSSEGKYFKMAGEKYSNGCIFSSTWHGYIPHALFNLNGKYSSISFDLGRVDGHLNNDMRITFIVDGKTTAEFDIEPESFPKNVTVPLNHGLQLKIVTNGGDDIGLANVIVE